MYLGSEYIIFKFNNLCNIDTTQQSMHLYTLAGKHVIGISINITIAARPGLIIVSMTYQLKKKHKKQEAF